MFGQVMPQAVGLLRFPTGGLSCVSTTIVCVQMQVFVTHSITTNCRTVCKICDSQTVFSVQGVDEKSMKRSHQNE